MLPLTPAPLCAFLWFPSLWFAPLPIGHYEQGDVELVGLGKNVLGVGWLGNIGNGETSFFVGLAFSTGRYRFSELQVAADQLPGIRAVGVGTAADQDLSILPDNNAHADFDLFHSVSL